MSKMYDPRPVAATQRTSSHPLRHPAFLMAGWLTSLFILALTTGSGLAQFEIPLNGPLIALNTVEQDRIIVYDLATDVYREISLGPGTHHVWDFSPDGCELLVTVADGARPARLWAVALDGQSQRALVAFDELPASDWGVWAPDWSPDGERIAFVMIRFQPRRGTIVRDTHIAWVPASGGAPQFYSVTGRETNPAWSPDGQWLAYTSYDERVPGADVFSTAVPTAEPPPGTTSPEPTLVREADLWVVSADGETKTRLTNFSVGNVDKPRWSPDGELIGFVFSMSGNDDMFWMIANRAGAIPTQLSNRWAQILDITWLPDGTQMIGAVRDFRDVTENRLWLIPLVGMADDNAALYLPNADLISADFPRFSPDGRYLATRTAYEMHLIDLTTSQARGLDERVFGNTPAVWSPVVFEGEASCSS